MKYWVVATGIIVAFNLTPIVAQAMMCEYSFETEVVGLAPKGGAYALRIRYHFSEQFLDHFTKLYPDTKSCSTCNYPKVNGRCHDGITLTLCQDSVGPDSIGRPWPSHCSYHWTIYAQSEGDPHVKPNNCTVHAKAAAELTKAKKAFKAAGVDLSVTPKPLEEAQKPELTRRLGQEAAEHGGFLLPQKLAKQLGLGDFVVLRHAFRKDGFAKLAGLEIVAPGFGTYFRHGKICVEECFTKAVLISPDRILFQIMTDCGNELTETVKIEVLAAHLRNNRGFKHHKAKDFKSSAADFKAAFDLHPTFAQAAFNLACAQALLGDKSAALDSLDQAISVGGARFKKKAAKDSDLNGLRDYERFKELLKK